MIATCIVESIDDWDEAGDAIASEPASAGIDLDIEVVTALVAVAAVGTVTVMEVSTLCRISVCIRPWSWGSDGGTGLSKADGSRRVEPSSLRVVFRVCADGGSRTD